MLPKLELASDDSLALPEYYEVIDGEIVEVPPMSDYANAVANRLNRTVHRYLNSNDFGDTGVELLFRIPQPTTSAEIAVRIGLTFPTSAGPKDRPFPVPRKRPRRGPRHCCRGRQPDRQCLGLERKGPRVPPWGCAAGVDRLSAEPGDSCLSSRLQPGPNLLRRRRFGRGRHFARLSYFGRVLVPACRTAAATGDDV